MQDTSVAFLNSMEFKWGVLGFFLLGLVLIYFTFIQLLRVEMDKEFVYVTNFFKIYRYSYETISKIKVRDLWLFKMASIHFAQSGKFGKKATFIISRRRFAQFIEENPSLFKDIIDESV